MPAFSAHYSLVKFWASVPTYEKQIGNIHDDIAVSSKNKVYVSVQGGSKAGVQMYDNKGNHLRNVPNAPTDFHGFVIRKTESGETATNKLPPAKWGPSYFSAPHRVGFNSASDLFVAEYTVFGRTHRFNVKQ